MAEIRIQTREIEGGWQFEVEIFGQNSKTNHQVTMNRDFYKHLTDEKISPEKLLRKSFEFLLERESAESILPKFNIEQISFYFPEYEKEITSKIGK